MFRFTVSGGVGSVGSVAGSVIGSVSGSVGCVGVCCVGSVPESVVLSVSVSLAGSVAVTDSVYVSEGAVGLVAGSVGL